MNKLSSIIIVVCFDFYFDLIMSSSDVNGGLMYCGYVSGEYNPIVNGTVIWWIMKRVINLPKNVDLSLSLFHNTRALDKGEFVKLIPNTSNIW